MIPLGWREALAASREDNDERLARLLEEMSPAELLTLHRATHKVAIESARTRRRRLNRIEALREGATDR